MATPSRLLGAAAAVGVAGIAFMLARKRNEAESSPKKPDGELLFAGVECGGTSFGVSFARGSPTNVIERYVVKTTTPKETLAEVTAILVKHAPDAVGVASFGPVDLNPKSKTYGFITSTPKLAWRQSDVLGAIKAALPAGLPVGFDTDVNAAALAEMKHGKHGDIGSCCYVTVGTGIGVGVVVGGHAVTGLMHPEGGHIRVERHPKDTEFKGICPYHADCLEGLAAANAIAARLGIKPEELKTLRDDDPVWDIEAHYLAQLCATCTMMLSPEVIILGGGVLHRASLYPKVRAALLRQLNGYINVPRITEHVDTYVVQSVWDASGNEKTSAGTIGALELARRALAAAAPAAAAAAASSRL